MQCLTPRCYVKSTAEKLPLINAVNHNFLFRNNITTHGRFWMSNFEIIPAHFLLKSPTSCNMKFVKSLLNVGLCKFAIVFQIKCHAHRLWWDLGKTLLIAFLIAILQSVTTELKAFPFILSSNCSSNHMYVSSVSLATIATAKTTMLLW